jgi:hypothetical protein
MPGDSNVLPEVLSLAAEPGGENCTLVTHTPRRQR